MFGVAVGVGESPISGVGVFHWVSCRGRFWPMVRGQAECCRLIVLLNNRFHSRSHGHRAGRCIVMRRAEDAIRAGMQIRVRRMVEVVAFARRCPSRQAAARVRLNAMTAHTSHAAFAQNFPEGRCANAEALRSAWTCSMIA